LTLFRALPPSAEEELRRRLSKAGSGPAPAAQISGAIDLDSGVALRVRSPELEMIRRELAEQFHGLLTSQDLGRWTAHVTVQNKVEPRVARALLNELRATIQPRSLVIRGLELVRYDAGSWQPLGNWKFR
jgi:hypothetical protein